MSSVGITGTRIGMDSWQHGVVERLLAKLYAGQGYDTLHHGDCVGVDAQVAEIARRIGFALVAHPPIDPRLRAHVPSNHVLAEKAYLERNRAIVHAADFMIACPDGPERLRSGTWATVRYATSLGHRVSVIMPRQAPEGQESAMT